MPELDSYAWPGGYPIYYLDTDNCMLCPPCANKEPDPATLDYGINYERDDLYCDECSKPIDVARYQETPA